MYRGLPSAATASHIHGPSVSTKNAGILHHLTPTQITNLLAGDLYVNVHTANNPSGEIRGQLCPTIIPLALNGANEPTPTGSPGTAVGFVVLVGKQFSVGLHYRDLTVAANNAHLHGTGLPGQSVGVLIPRNNASYFSGGFGVSGFLIGSETTTDAIAGHIVDGFTHLNIHTPGPFSGGEIRGQVTP